LTYSEIGDIYPQHVLKDVKADEITSAPFATTPLGAGAWKVQSWTKKQEMVLVAN